MHRFLLDSTRFLCASGLLGTLLSLAVQAAPEQISSGEGPRFETLGISEDGRYVLYSDPNDCDVYRKDNRSDE